MDPYLRWLRKKLNIIVTHIKNGATVSQAFYLSGCSGVVSNGVPIHIFKQVDKVVFEYRSFLKNYTKKFVIYFSTLIYYATKEIKNLNEELETDIQRFQNIKLSVEDVKKYFLTVQSLVNKNYVFKFCLIPENQNRKLYHAPSNFPYSNLDQYSRDTIYTLFMLGNEKSHIGLLQKRKFFYLPFVPPRLGYFEEDLEQGDFRIFYSKKDDTAIVREKIMKLFK